MTKRLTARDAIIGFVGFGTVAIILDILLYGMTAALHSSLLSGAMRVRHGFLSYSQHPIAFVLLFGMAVVASCFLVIADLFVTMAAIALMWGLGYQKMRDWRNDRAQ